MDYQGTTDWYKTHIGASFSPVSENCNSGHTDLMLQNNTEIYKTSYRTFTCAYNPVAPQTCRLDGQSISSDTVTQTHTTSYSFQVRGTACRRAAGRNDCPRVHTHTLHLQCYHPHLCRARWDLCPSLRPLALA